MATGYTIISTLQSRVQVPRQQPPSESKERCSAKRTGRIFIDYLRNGRGTTAVGASSPRARPGFPISKPVSWADIEAGIAPDVFTMDRP
ncbi:hypothetical protein [Mesorhizobium sp. WSM2240]|uniref:DNA ligase D polymerase domain-containing protein n=1 Tax=Mesorhizobium sp. WSM2240 TaxID=3228851 RepID=A0AAU8CX75_9HYPH